MLAAEIKAFPFKAGAHSLVESSDAWKRIIAPVDGFLERVTRHLLQQSADFAPEIAPYAEYALAAQGKQIRPVLVGLSGRTVGSLQADHVKVAAIIEMIHLATLVHDDVIDEASVRRGRPTLSSQWGNEIAVLVGDCLFAQALKLAAEFETVEVAQAVSRAAHRVCSGEIMQTQRRRNFRVSQADYLRTLEMKTAELFALACELGGSCSGAAAESRKALRGYGLALGTAYQIFDDCLDLFGSERLAGKSLGTDLAKGKLTLPLLVCWERADAADRRLLEELVDQWDPGQASVLRGLLEKHDVMEHTFHVLQDHLEQARKFLDPFLESDGKQNLLLFSDFLWAQAVQLGV